MINVKTKIIIIDFEYGVRKTSSARRPDLTLEDLQVRKIWLIDMVCPSESNIENKLREKRSKYQQLAFEIREKRPSYLVEIISFVIGCLGGGMKKLEDEMAKLIPEEKRRLKITGEMKSGRLNRGLYRQSRMLRLDYVEVQQILVAREPPP